MGEKTAHHKGLAKTGLMYFVLKFSYKFSIGTSINSLPKSHAFAKPQTVLRYAQKTFENKIATYDRARYGNRSQRRRCKRKMV